MSADPQSPLDPSLTSKAVAALLKHFIKEQQATEKSTLLPTDEFVSLVITLKKIPGAKKIKPIRIPLPHSLHDSDATLCLFVKDPQRTFKEYIEEHRVKGITKVIGVDKLRKKFSTFEAKRNLLHSYDLFAADDRVLPLLPRLIGKHFFDKKKQPAPVSVTKMSDLASEIQKTRKATFMFLNTGSCLAIKIGRTSQTVDQISKNITSRIDQIVEKIPKKWKNIKALHIKTSNSVALPIYNSLPEVADEEEIAEMEAEKAKALERKEKAKAKALAKLKRKGQSVDEDEDGDEDEDEDEDGIEAAGEGEEWEDVEEEKVEKVKTPKKETKSKQLSLPNKAANGNKDKKEKNKTNNNNKNNNNKNSNNTKNNTKNNDNNKKNSNKTSSNNKNKQNVNNNNNNNNNNKNKLNKNAIPKKSAGVTKKSKPKK